MVQGLLWIVGTYVLGAAAVHAAHRIKRHTETDTRHYVLYTLNDGGLIEWAVRSLVMYYWLQGRHVTITVIDEGSTDETLDIVSSLSRRHALQVRRSVGEPDYLVSNSSKNDSEWIHIRLSHPEDLRKLPLTFSVR